MSHKPAKSVAIFAKHNSTAKQPIWPSVASLLLGKGYRVMVSDRTSNCTDCGFELASIDKIRQEADFAVIVGGDGTFLGIARELAGVEIQLIGINQGRLGFLTDIQLDQIDPILVATLGGDSVLEKRRFLTASIQRKDSSVFEGCALNDIVISRGIVGGMVELRVEVDGQFMYDLRADGLIVSTPTGSTAYALSADGPILHPSLAGLVMVPVAPHALTNRPIALPDHCIIDVYVTGGKQTGVHYDMQRGTRARIGDRIRIEVSPQPIQLLHPAKYDYFAMLRQKLHWSASPTDLSSRSRGLRESFHAK